MAYILNVQIAGPDLGRLKEEKCVLHLTKGMKYDNQDMPGDFVFASVISEQMAPNLEFSWDERYQTHMTAMLKAGHSIKVSTESYDTLQGMTATFDANGTASISGMPDEKKAIEIVNNWKNAAQIVLNNYNPAAAKFVTIFISPPVSLHSINHLVPTPRIGLFFDGESESGTKDASSSPFTVNFQNKRDVTVRYENGYWRVLDAAQS